MYSHPPIAIEAQGARREHKRPLGADQARARRVVAITLVLATLNVVDLWQTVTAHRHGALFEANPIAAYVINTHGVIGISLFKTALVAVAIGGFVSGRRSWLAEVGCTTVAVIYVAVVCLWARYPLETLASF